MTTDDALGRPPEADDWVSIADVAVRCGRSVQTIRQLERDEKIPRAHRDPHTDRRFWPAKEAQMIVDLLRPRLSRSQARARTRRRPPRQATDARSGDGSDRPPSRKGSDGDPTTRHNAPHAVGTIE